MPNCAQCGAENQPGALFCEMCGTRLATAPAQPAAQPPAATTVPAAAGGLVSCPTCGASAIPGEAFCENCGASLAGASAVLPGQPAVAPPQPPAQPAPQPVYPPPQPIAPPVPVAGSSACPSCGAATIPGEAFCENCGAMLSAPSNLTPRQPSPPPAPQATVPAPPAPQPTMPAPPAPSPAPQQYTPPPPPQPPAPVGLTSLQGMAFEIAGQRIALPAQAEAIIGRQDPASGHFPDVDMAPHGAMEHGVGRRHARIFVRGGQIQLEDLDSTNGTLVNKQKLKPRQPATLTGGEELRFGTLAVTFRRGA